MGEVTGRDLVDRDGGTHGGAEDGQPVMLGLLVPGLLGRGDVVASRGVVLERPGPVHHGRSPSPGRGSRADLARAARGRQEVVADHERRGLVDRLPGGGIDSLFTRVVSEEFWYQPRRRHPRRQSLARLMEPGAKPAALLVGSLLQAAEINRHRLRVPDQAGQRRRAERGIRAARGGGILDSPEQPGVRLQGGDLDIGRAADSLGESPHRLDERSGHRRRDGLQRLQGGVDGRGPLAEVCLPRPPALRLGGVLAVVAGHVQVLDVGKRVPLQDLGLGFGPGGPLGREQVTLVVGVGEALARRTGPEAGQGRLAAARRQVHHDAVVLVDPCELPDDRDLHVPYGFEAAIRHTCILHAMPILRVGGAASRTRKWPMFPASKWILILRLSTSSIGLRHRVRSVRWSGDGLQVAFTTGTAVES